MAEDRKPMYKITCETCGDVGFHPSRLGAESRAEAHDNRTDHDSRIETMTEPDLSL